MKTRPGILGATISSAVFLMACGPKKADNANADQDRVAIQRSLDEIARSFNAGDYDAMFAQYRDDVRVLASGQAELVGKQAWRDALAKIPPEVKITMRFDTKEVRVSGNLAYESGSFTMETSEKATGKALGSVTNRHVHVFERGDDGKWLGWRLFELQPEASPTGAK